MASTSAPKKLSFLSIIALIGLALAVSLTEHFYALRAGTAGFKSACDVSAAFNCDAVAASRFAEVFWGLPLSSFAAGWYLAIFVVSLLARDVFWRRDSVRALFLLTGFGVLTSIAYFFIMMTSLKVYCIECLGIDACNLISFALVLAMKPEPLSPHRPEKQKWKIFAGTTAAALLVAIIGLRQFEAEAMPKDEIDRLVEATLTSPTLPVNAGDEFASFGPKNAPVTIVEFSDFQCPFCKLGAKLINAVENRYRDQVRIVFRNYPLDRSCNSYLDRPVHEVACAAARVGVCAQQQGKFREVYETFFENQSSLSLSGSGRPEELAARAGLDPNALGACIGATSTQLRIAKDIEEGHQLGVQSTPTFFLNGHRIEGAYPVAAWEKMIDRLLSTRSTASTR